MQGQAAEPPAADGELRVDSAWPIIAWLYSVRALCHLDARRYLGEHGSGDSVSLVRTASAPEIREVRGRISSGPWSCWRFGPATKGWTALKLSAAEQELDEARRALSTRGRIHRRAGRAIGRGFANGGGIKPIQDLGRLDLAMACAPRDCQAR